MLKSGTTSEDTTSEQNRVHEGTAALQPRYTDARATSHMTPTPTDPDSFAGWSDARCSPGVVRDTPFPQVGISGLSGQVTDGGMFLDPVCTFTRCQPFAFGVLRVIMSEPSLNVQMIGCRARVGTHKCPLGGHVGLKSSDFTTVSLNTVPFLFFTRQKKQYKFSLDLQFFTKLEKVCFLEVYFFTHQKKQCFFFYTGIAIFTLLGKLCFAV